MDKSGTDADKPQPNNKEKCSGNCDNCISKVAMHLEAFSVRFVQNKTGHWIWVKFDDATGYIERGRESFSSLDHCKRDARLSNSTINAVTQQKD